MRLARALFLSGLVLFLFLLSLSPSAAAIAPPSPFDRARDILHAGADSKDASVRLQTVVASSLIGVSPVVATRLQEMLSDKSVNVRVAAVNALTDLKIRSSVPALEKTLAEDDTPEVVYAAAKALYSFNNESGRDALEEIFDRRTPAKSGILRRQARDFFGKFHSLKSSVLTVVSEGIGFVPIPGAGAGMSALTELLGDPEFSVRANTVILLGRANTPTANDVLHRALSDKDWSVRAAAVQVIAQSARVALQKDLLALFDDSNDKVRYRAAGAYLHLDVLRQKRTSR